MELAALQQECQQLAQQIQELRSTARTPSRLEADSQSNRKLFAEIKQRSILAEKKFYETHPLTSQEISTPGVLSIQFNDHVIESFESTDYALLAVRKQIEEESAALESEKKLLAEREELKAAFESLAMSSRRSLSDEDQIRAKATMYHKASKQLMMQMSIFLDQRFPPDSSVPENTTLPQIAKHHAKAQTGEIAPLKSLLEALMNLSVQQPQNPYLDISEQYWPPHVELLLSSHIVTRHPTNSNLIRLVDFSS
eukprot:c7096_g1_i2.p1 GENE.c7096_g1_i2~~c7096_g1_i2.p1  ORF type:complete len:253 (+),score=47.93 c7096_g1_i2:23-781(+)